MRATAILLATVLVWASPSLAQENPKTKPPSLPGESPPATTTAGRTGINVSGDAFVGEMAPDFQIDGSHGKPVQLAHLHGDWVILVFNERRANVMDMASIASDLKLLGGVILAVCHEKTRQLEQAQQRDPLPFEVGADPTGEVSSQYGAFDRVTGTMVPGVFVIDRHGKVRLAVLGEKVPPEAVLDLARLPMSSSQ